MTLSFEDPHLGSQLLMAWQKQQRRLFSDLELQSEEGAETWDYPAESSCLPLHTRDSVAWRDGL